MPSGVEGDPLVDSGQSHDALQTMVAPAVARQAENRDIVRFGGVVVQDGARNGKEPDAYRRSRFAARRIEPQLAVRRLEVAHREPPDVGIGEPREATEKKDVPNEPQHGAAGVEDRHTPDFLHRQDAARNGFALEAVIGKRVAVEVSARAGKPHDVLQCGQVDPYGILAVAALAGYVGMESDQELVRQFGELQIGPLEPFVQVTLEVQIDTPIFIIGRPAPADADHALELFVVTPEKAEQRLTRGDVAHEALLDHLGRHLAPFIAPGIVITAFDRKTDGFQAGIDVCRRAAASGHAALSYVPRFGRYGEMGRELRPSSVDGNAPHDRDASIAQRRISLDVEQNPERVSHSCKFVSWVPCREVCRTVSDR